VVWEVYPEVKELMVYTLCLRALETQESFIFEEYEPPLGRWLEQRVIPSEHGVTIIGRDLTAWRNVTSDLARLEREVAERDTRLRQLVVVRMASELSTAPSQVVAPDSDRADVRCRSAGGCGGKLRRPGGLGGGR
jgi:hypothetical protein